MPGVEISLGFAFLAGLASFLSPCVFSLVPAYVGYLGGRSASNLSSGESSRWTALSHGVAFVLGFSVVFILLGMATSAIGSLLYDARDILARVGGVIVIFFGLHMTGILRIPFLEYDLRRQTAPDRSRGYLASALMGVFFSAGWSPCVGPILGTILGIAMFGGSVVQGVSLLSAYSAGLAIPFLIASVQIGLVTRIIRRYGKVMRYIEIVMGLLLLVVGVLLFAGQYSRFASLAFFFPASDEVLVGRYLLIGLAALVVLALVPGYLGRRKGRSFLDWYLFGLGLFPVALIAALLVKPRSAGEPQPGEGEPGQAGNASARGDEEALPRPG